MPRDIFRILGRAWVVGRQLRISKLSDHASQRSAKQSHKNASKPDIVDLIPKAADESPKPAKKKKQKKATLHDELLAEATQVIENA
jgi:hypothetical protein